MPRFRSLCFLILFLGMVSPFAETAFAGPPFLNDDPEPVEYRHWEAYLFSTHDVKRQTTDAQGPAFEVNVGALPNLQLHLVVPFAYTLPKEGKSAFGLGDIEVGCKYRFIQETGWRPQVGIFPLLEVPTGSSSRGLGNGRPWGKLPLLFQKSWGPWTTYGGFGYALNPAPEQRHHFYGGWVVQRDLGKWLTLGGEVFVQEKDSDEGQHFVILNFGGIIKISPNFNILFSTGHSIAGEDHFVGYLGLYWTWGPAAGQKQAKLISRISGGNYESIP
jgi:hypothetical protein